MTAIGHIYKIICTVDQTFCYIGSTFNRLGKRFEMHRAGYSKWLNGKSKKSMSCYPFYKKHGIENFKIVLIKSYEVCREHVKDRRHLEAYETLWVCRTKCVNVNMPIQYHKKEHRKQYQQNNSERKSEQQRKYREQNRELIAAQKKQHSQLNSATIAVYQKGYYEANHERLLEYHREYGKQQVTCECGHVLRKDSLSRHRKTKKHINLMASK